MKLRISKKLKTNKKFLLIGICIVIFLFILPYITIPVVILWWFYKKSKFSKKIKIITTTSVVALLVIFSTAMVIAYTKDVEPSLSITQPSSLKSSIKAPQITIKGTYQPSDRRVWINGKEISVANGNFQTIYQLKEGVNTIDVEAGDWKRTDIYLTVTRAY